MNRVAVITAEQGKGRFAKAIIYSAVVLPNKDEAIKFISTILKKEDKK